MKEKVIIITGAGSGIGQDCAQLFLQENCMLRLVKWDL